MPKQKARKSLFSVLSLRLKTSGMKGCVLRGKGWLFQEVRIPKNVDIFVYQMMHRGMRHEEVQKLHVDNLHVFKADSARHSSQRNTETLRRRFCVKDASRTEINCRENDMAYENISTIICYSPLL